MQNAASWYMKWDVLSVVQKTRLLGFECSMGEKCGVMVYEVGIWLV